MGGVSEIKNLISITREGGGGGLLKTLHRFENYYPRMDPENPIRMAAKLDTAPYGSPVNP